MEELNRRDIYILRELKKGQEKEAGILREEDKIISDERATSLE